MTPERYQQVKRVFAEASALLPTERAAYLDRKCADDVDLRAEVESLLAHDEKSLPIRPRIARAEALANLAAGGSSARVGLRAGPESLPKEIGHYRILREIGRGGMGVVYEAEQDNPRRRIALKAIRPGLVSEQLLRRFELEAQVLGRLQHPGIAQVYEAGAASVQTASGITVEQPFFAMEYVRGRPLGELLGREEFSTRARLELFARICDAVQHAHQKGVIHRDLKPGNILVDERGQPKILDFGVARITDADVQVTTLHTDVGQLIGTLPYMSPEQVAGDPHEIDTRSDVYALGVLGYQLLTGRLPYAVQDKTIPEAARTIAEENPTPLSAINRVFRGDLEAIVTKALEKEKDRRYQSASDLAADVRRYLADKPVEARPVTAWYQLRKFARRNRGLVASIAGISGLLVVGTVVSTWLAIWALGAEGLARERYTQAEDARKLAEQQRHAAETEAARATALGGFLVRTLQQVDPDLAQGRDVTLLRDVLDGAAHDIESELAAYPDVQADMHRVIGAVYRNLSRYDEAEQHYQAAYDLGLQLHGEDDADTLAALRGLAQVHWDRGELDEAEVLYEQIVATCTATLGPHHRDTLTARYDRAAVWGDQGRIDETDPELRDILAAMRAHLDPEDNAIYEVMNGVAVSALQRGQTTDQTEPMLRAVVRHWTEVYGPRHPRRLRALRNLAIVVKERGALEEAEALTRELLARHQEVFGEDHHDTIQLKINLASLLREKGDREEAESLIREAYEQAARVLGPAHPDTLIALTQLGIILRQTGQLDEARRRLEEAVRLSEEQHGPNAPKTLNRLSSLAGVFFEQKQFAEAEPVVRRVVEGLATAYGEHSSKTLAAMNNHGLLLVEVGRLEEAEQTFRRLIALLDEAAPPGHWFSQAARANLGHCLTRMERFEEAEPVLLECYEKLTTSMGAAHPRTVGAAEKLVELYTAWGRPEEAARYAQATGADSGADAPE